MQRLLGITAALSGFASMPWGLRLHMNKQNHIPGTHVSTLAGEEFELHQPGEHVLFKVTKDVALPPFIRVSGSFVAAEHAPCALYMVNVSITGEGLGNHTFRVRKSNGSLALKVSSSSPAYAGKWQSINSFDIATDVPAALTNTMSLVADATQESFVFQVGSPGTDARPTVKLTPGLHEGLDMSLSNMNGLEAPKVAGLLGTDKHNMTLEALPGSCEVHAERMRKHPSASHRFAAWSVRPTFLRNLVGEGFRVNQPGDYSLLRVPKNKTQPALLNVRGRFFQADNVSCIMSMTAVTLNGLWFGPKTVHVTSDDGVFRIKVSTTDPPVANKPQSIEEFVETSNGTVTLLETVQVVASAEIPSFRFDVGPFFVEDRPRVLLSQALCGGIEVSLPDIRNVDPFAPELGGLLGTDKHDKALDVRTADCEATLRRFSEEPGGSSLIASWTQ